MYLFVNVGKSRYKSSVWNCFIDTFNYMPIAALIEEKIICMHGGLSPYINRPDDILMIDRPSDISDDGPMCDILWADPTTEWRGWGHSLRGVSFTFGPDVTTSFLRANDLDLVCRAHQVVEDGYEFCHNKKVVTLFSAPNYCGLFENCGAFMKVDCDLQCSFHILKPENKKMGFKQSRPPTPVPRRL